MRIEPIGDNVVVRRLEADERTAGGLHLPDNARERPRQGRVLSVGDGRQLLNGRRSSHQVQEGDRVLFNEYSGTEIQFDGEAVLILRESEILAVLD